MASVHLADIDAQPQCLWMFVVPSIAIDIASAVIVADTSMAMSQTLQDGIFGNRVLVAYCVIGSNLGAAAALAFGFPRRTYSDIAESLRRWVFGMALGIFATPLVFPYTGLPYTVDAVMGASGAIAGGAYFTIKHAAPVWAQFVKAGLRDYLQSKIGGASGGPDSGSRGKDQ